MTREIAKIKVELLDNYLSHTCQDYGERDHEAMMMAIKALEQEPVVDKIRTEIETKYGHCDICEYFEDYDYEENDISEYRPIGNIADILQILDKYKAEQEK